MTSVQERADLLSKLGLDGQNKAALGQVLGTGRIGQATERSDGRMEATIRIRPDEISWDPTTWPRFDDAPFTEVIQFQFSTIESWRPRPTHPIT